MRFPLTLELRYAVGDPRAPGKTGSGRTIDLSSSGLSFTTDTPPLTGEKLHVSINWPTLLDGNVQLQLIISGVVVRSKGTITALRSEHHEFRTRRVGLQVVPSQASAG